MKLAFIDLAAHFLGKDINSAETTVVAGALILLAGVAQTYDKPVSRFLSKHGLKQVGNGGAAMDVGNGPGEDGSNIQLLDLLAEAVLRQGNSIMDH